MGSNMAKIGTGVMMVALALAPIISALAFPTTSTTYPNSSGCYAATTADAYVNSGSEVVYAWTDDYTGCAYTVWARAAMFQNPGTTYSGWDYNVDYAYNSLQTTDYYYGYAQGVVNGGSTFTTGAVHP
jgi:hypothetical protein